MEIVPIGSTIALPSPHRHQKGLQRETASCRVPGVTHSVEKWIHHCVHVTHTTCMLRMPQRILEKGSHPRPNVFEAISCLNTLKTLCECAEAGVGGRARDMGEGDMEKET